MKLSDIFMLVLVVNAFRNIDVFSYIIFACAIVCAGVRVLQWRDAE